jgi:hypothetical protein
MTGWDLAAYTCCRPFWFPVGTEGCGVGGNLHSITISIIDWTRAVGIGTRGHIYFQLINTVPIIQVQVKVGAQMIGEVNGTELRDLGGLYFSVPRVPGNYGISISAKDRTGCTGETTLPRSVTVS